MIVYTADPTTGAYTLVDGVAVKCRLATISMRGATSSPERAELAQLRRLTWGPTYTMPDHAQVLIGGVRYNVVQETITAATYPPTGGVMHYSADVVRAD
jgi:hypothetical protein